MTNLPWVILAVVALALLGSLALVLVTIKYYWAGRGKPPATGAERRRQRAEELRIRATQIERARSRSVLPRKSSFWDNTKSS
jgi:hypothetical protein